MVIARSLVTKIEGELARWPRRKCLFLRYFAASGLSRSWLCSAVKMRGLSGSNSSRASTCFRVFLCVSGWRNRPTTATNVASASSGIFRLASPPGPITTSRLARRSAASRISLLQQLLVNQPVKGLAIFKLIDAHHHRFRERVILSGIGVERFARGKVQMQRINFLIKTALKADFVPSETRWVSPHPLRQSASRAADRRF